MRVRNLPQKGASSPLKLQPTTGQGEMQGGPSTSEKVGESNHFFARRPSPDGIKELVLMGLRGDETSEELLMLKLERLGIA